MDENFILFNFHENFSNELVYPLAIKSSMFMATPQVDIFLINIGIVSFLQVYSRPSCIYIVYNHPL